MITTQKSLPCLQEMVHNYLSEARLRSWEEGFDNGLHHDGFHRFEKDRGMKVLQAEERKRREGRECVSPTCRSFPIVALSFCISCPELHVVAI